MSKNINQDEDEENEKEFNAKNYKLKSNDKEESKGEGQEDEEEEDEDESDDEPAIQQQQEEQKVNQIPRARPVENLQILDMHSFLTKPVPKGLLLQCTIKRDKSGFARFYPKYNVHLSNGFKYLFSAKKKAYNKTSNYSISMDKNDFSKKSQSFLGKVRSNFLGTEFVVYDRGENPKKAKTNDQVRKELAIVLYDSNLLGARGPRKMRALIPDLKQDGQPLEWKPNSNKESMLNKYKAGSIKGTKFFYNKPPKWNEAVQAFVLNFNGRVDKPSVKNFQLVDDQDDEIIYLQFGRVGDDVFHMDFQWPMTPLQAFGICVTSFDYKIACE